METCSRRGGDGQGEANGSFSNGGIVYCNVAKDFAASVRIGPWFNEHS